MPGAPTMFLGPLAIPADRAREGEPAALAGSARRRAIVVGTDDPHVCSLLTDVLRDIQLEVRTADATGGEPGEPPDVILAMVDRVNGVRSITEARAGHRGVPLVAILPLGTHRLATRAIAAGAQACYMLDMPIDRLRGLLLALLSDAPASGSAKSRKSARASR